MKVLMVTGVIPEVNNVYWIHLQTCVLSYFVFHLDKNQKRVKRDSATSHENGNFNINGIQIRPH